MSRPTSSNMLTAIESVRGGMTAYAAAKLHGVAKSNLSRHLHKKPPIICPCCGQKIKVN